jgi:hypothetical protein
MQKAAATCSSGVAVVVCDDSAELASARDLKIDSDNPRHSLMNSIMSSPMVHPRTALEGEQSLANEDRIWRIHSVMQLS